MSPFRDLERPAARVNSPPPPIELDGLRPTPDRRGERPARPGHVTPPRATVRTPPGEFTPTAVLAAALGLSAIASGVEADRAPLVVVGAAAFAVLAVGIVWPIIALHRVSISADLPRDAYVDDLVPIDVTIDGTRARLEIRVLEPASPWHAALGATHGTLHHLMARRGVFRGIRIEVRSSAPLGVFMRRKVLWVMLPHAIFVAPRPLRVAWRPTFIGDAVGNVTDASAAAAGGDSVRSVRAYAPGDAARMVHWPTTARRGALVVRELEPPPTIGLAIVVELSTVNGDRAERAAAHAGGLARAVIAAGGLCWLVTRADPGGVSAQVASVREIDRRLAAASPGDPGAAPAGWPAVHIDDGPATPALRHASGAATDQP